MSGYPTIRPEGFLPPFLPHAGANANANVVRRPAPGVRYICLTFALRQALPPIGFFSQTPLQADELKARLADARQRLTVKMATLEPRRAEWEKQPLARYEAGDLAWRFQRPERAQSQNGAVLKVYNEQPVEFSSSEGGSGVTERRPGNGLIVAGWRNAGS